MKTDKNSTDMTDIKEEYFRNLIKQGHHRRAPNMTVDVITVDSEEDDYIDVENFEFDDTLKVMPTLKIKEEPSFDMDMDSSSEESEREMEQVKQEFTVPGRSVVDSPVVRTPWSPMSHESTGDFPIRSPGNFPVQSPVAYTPQSPMSYVRSPGDFPVQSPLFYASQSSPVENFPALNALVKVATEEEEQESRTVEEKPAEPDNWEEKQNRRLARDNAKRKQSTRFVARRQPRGLEEELDALEKSHTKKKPTTLIIKPETKHKHRTSPKKRDSIRSPREGDIRKSLSPNMYTQEREKRHSPKKRARTEDETSMDKEMSNALKKKRRRSKSPISSPNSNSRSTILIDDMATIPLNLNEFKSKNTEKSKKYKVEQDISSERIHNLEDKLNELKILKLNYQLYQLQQLKSNMTPNNQFI